MLSFSKIIYLDNYVEVCFQPNINAYILEFETTKKS